MQIKGKTALVTGGRQRIGAVIAKALEKEGVQVAVHSHRSQPFCADLNQFDQIKTLVQDVEKTLGPVQILVNNAAIFERIPFSEVGEKDWERHLAINLKAPFFLAQAAARTMLEKKCGKIINIADVAAWKFYRDYSIYSITKAGLIALTKTLARELAPHIQVNAIAPGPILPPIYYKEELKNKIADKTLQKRWGDPQEIANAVLFLLKEADFATGSVLTLDGGRSLV